MRQIICQGCDYPKPADPTIHYRNFIQTPKGRKEVWTCRECYEKLAARDWHQRTLDSMPENVEKL